MSGDVEGIREELFIAILNHHVHQCCVRRPQVRKFCKDDTARLNWRYGYVPHFGQAAGLSLPTLIADTPTSTSLTPPVATACRPCITDLTALARVRVLLAWLTVCTTEAHGTLPRSRARPAAVGSASTSTARGATTGGSRNVAVLAFPAFIADTATSTSLTPPVGTARRPCVTDLTAFSRVRVLLARLAVCACETLGTLPRSRHVAILSAETRVTLALARRPTASPVTTARSRHVAGIATFSRVCVLLARLAVCACETLGTLLRSRHVAILSAETRVTLALARRPTASPVTTARSRHVAGIATFSRVRVLLARLAVCACETLGTLPCSRARPAAVGSASTFAARETTFNSMGTTSTSI